MKRLKVPAAIAQFYNPLDESNCKNNYNIAKTLFKLLSKYCPETKNMKQERLKGKAKKEIKNQKKKSEKPNCLKFGLNHVTYLIEQKKAKLVVIAADVDPIETVLFLPTLCRAMDVPFCITKSM
jgi:large subunit ribosomal protein L7Ae